MRASSSHGAPRSNTASQARARKNGGNSPTPGASYREPACTPMSAAGQGDFHGQFEEYVDYNIGSPFLFALARLGLKERDGFHRLLWFLQRRSHASPGIVAGGLAEPGRAG